ncbi:MAG TPA: hypothetical protein VIS72_14345 [Anaerolineales bacterium]
MNDKDNITIESDESKRRTIIFLLSGAIVLGICMIVAGGYFWLGLGQNISFEKSLSTPTYTPAPVNSPTPAGVPNEVIATLLPPGAPLEFAHADEAKKALDSGIEFLESYAVEFPNIPEINQPGDVYTFNLFLYPPVPLIWSYGWCTTTAEILEENFNHIQLEFIADDVMVSEANIAIFDDVRTDGSPCRNYSVLIEGWSEGDHTLQTRVTFTQDIDDGWDLYPAGTHTYEYFVPVFP